jgi:hypothetical protein
MPAALLRIVGQAFQPDIDVPKPIKAGKPSQPGKANLLLRKAPRGTKCSMWPAGFLNSIREAFAYLPCDNSR